jgi:hypothetical protein
VKDFALVLQRLRAQANYEWGQQQAKLTAQDAKNDNLGSSRRWFPVQQHMQEALSKFGATALQRLKSAEAQHSPYSIEDFNLAIEAIAAFADDLRTSYDAKLSEKSPFGGSKPVFDLDAMNRTVQIAQDKIYAARAEYRSQRSPLRWALGAGTKQLFTTVVAFVAGIILKTVWDSLS